jgi:uncharacterized C2H2 Zn-finger protein
MEKVTCKMCGAEFDNDEELMKHNAEAHGMADAKSDGDFKCEACGASFASQDELDAHAKEAHGDM